MTDRLKFGPHHLNEAVFSAWDRLPAGEWVDPFCITTYPDGTQSADIEAAHGVRIREVSARKLVPVHPAATR